MYKQLRIDRYVIYLKIYEDFNFEPRLNQTLK